MSQLRETIREAARKAACRAFAEGPFPTTCWFRARVYVDDAVDTSIFHFEVLDPGRPAPERLISRTVDICHAIMDEAPYSVEVARGGR